MRIGVLAVFSVALAAFLAAQTPAGKAGPGPQVAEELKDFPQALISNGVVHATVYLPDTEKGYYQATRFDWSGVIPSLLYQGHNYFGQWFSRYDPKINDAIMGPVEEFGNNALGFNEAAPGGTFVKVGVGALKKPEGRPYNHATTYDIVDSGKWSVRKGPDFVEFTQVLTDNAGYAYVYRKTVRLAKGKPVLTLEHSLKNTGQKTIESSVYDHDFYMFDGQPAGPDYTVKFPFEVHWIALASPLMETAGKELHYLSELQPGQTAQSNLTGYDPKKAADYDIRVENKKTGSGVRQTSDRPIARINFWTIRTTVCPEAYIDVTAAPGQEFTWKINYEFYTIPPTK
jgi:hypothetical protein